MAGRRGPYPAGSLNRAVIEVALATGTAPGDWTDIRAIETAVEILEGRNG